MPEFLPRELAYLGDAVLSLKIREWILTQTAFGNSKTLHTQCSHLTSAVGQADLLEKLQSHLTDNELNLLRRARNAPIAVGRKHQQKLHRQSTAIEALFGYWYLNDPTRLTEIWPLVDAWLLMKLAQHNTE